MKRMLGPLLLAAMASAAAASPAPGPAKWDDAQRPERTRNVWEGEYRGRSAADMAAQFESDRRPVYRHRKDILRLLELGPGMTVAEIGAGSGFLSRMAAREVGPGGRVVATELDPKMVAYINERAAAERLLNLAAIQGRVDGAGLDTQSMDAIVVVNTYSFFDRPAEMMRSIAGALKPGGLLLIVDFVRPDGPTVQDVITTAAAAGLAPIDRSDVVPSHFAVRFRKGREVEPAGAEQGRSHEPAPLHVVFLRKGPQFGTEATFQEGFAVGAAHWEFLAGLSRKRINLLSGVFLDDGDPRGIAVLDVRDEQEALSLMYTNPHIRAGHLALDVRPWSGPRGAFHPPSSYDIRKNEAHAPFVIGIYADGPNRSQRDDRAAALDRAHHAHLAQLQRQRKVAVFGDFVAGNGLRGLVVFRVETVEEARELASTDPAVQAGRLVLEARPFMTLAGTLERQ